MARKQVGRKVDGWKAKSWYKVYTPDSFGKTEIGNTISNDPEKVMGRVLTATLAEISQDFSKSHIAMRFKVNSVTGDAAYTEFAGHQVTRDHLRSMIKRRASRVDALFPVTTKDGKKVRLTITCLTLSRANVGQAQAIRRKIQEEMVKKAAEADLDSYIKDIVSGESAKELFKEIKEIYPVRRIEIIKSKVE
jgi:small subunit ribosomal protein S3Ae